MASIVTVIFLLLIVGAIVATLSMDEPLPGMIAGGVSVLFIAGAWSIYGLSGYFANTRFDEHDRKVELGLAADASKTEAQVLIELRTQETNQQNFNRAVSRPINGSPYGSPYGASHSNPNFSVGFGNNY
jgi:hypothetical protein